jgi:hypothetical protein
MFLFVSQVQAALPGMDYSPPGLSSTYQKLGKIIKTTPYDKQLSWFETNEGTFLLNNTEMIEFIKISTFEKWYCVAGFPGYCGKLLGLNGKIITDAPDYIWPISIK